MSAPDSAGPRPADVIRGQGRPFVVYWNNIPSFYANTGARRLIA